MLRPSDFRKEGNPHELHAELEKGLRSKNVGVVCEAVLLCSRMFTLFPFSTFINSTFLKLADLFREGDNNVRFRILKATEASKHHLGKIMSTDEVLRRLLSVYHSNDPLARSITLRIIACFADESADRKDAHHCILNGLGSLDECESAAAIYAADNYSKTSASFTAAIVPVLSQMIQALETSIPLKTRLAKILRHAYHNMAVINGARELCTTILRDWSVSPLVQTVLWSSTILVATSLAYAPEQLQLLSKHVRFDARQRVKLTALAGMERLAIRSPHAWQQRNIQELCVVLEATTSPVLLVAVLRVLSALAGSTRYTLLVSLRAASTRDASHTENATPPLELLEAWCASPISEIAFESAGVLCLVATRLEECTDPQAAAVARTALAMASRVLLRVAADILGIETDEAHDQQIPPYLQRQRPQQVPWSGKKDDMALCDATLPKDTECRAPQSFKNFLGRLVGVICATPSSAGEHVQSVLKVLLRAAWHAHDHGGRFVHISILLLRCMQRCVVAHTPSSSLLSELANTETTAVASFALETATIVGLSIRSQQNHARTDSMDPTATYALLDSAVAAASNQEGVGMDCWHVYKFARRLSCLGFHQCAERLFQRIEPETTTERVAWWIDAVCSVSHAEAQCVPGDGGLPCTPTQPAVVAARLQNAAEGYEQAVTVFRAARVTSTDCAFQIAFCECRHSALRCAVDLLRMLISCRGEGRIETTLGLLPRVYSDLSQVFTRYKAIATSHFDMDEQSIAVLKSHQDVILSITRLVYGLVPADTAPAPPVLETPTVDKHQVCNGPITSTAISLVYQRIHDLITTDAFTALPVPQALATLRSYAADLFSIPCVIPPLLYSRLQPTTMQLSLFPYPRPGQILTAISGHEFVLRVEGVMRTSETAADGGLPSAPTRKRLQLRKVAMIDVTVTLTCAGEILQTLTDRVGLSATAFFTATFAFALPHVDVGEMPLTICVAPAIVDQGGICWATHASESYNFRVLSKTNKGQKPMAAARGAPR
eukprot:m.980380 g.980380  ORF g.980380 m.980380 type:complete len:1008 (-) comp23966_c0_seq1:670-3693(-)